MDCKLAISSMSLGRCFAGHSFEHKLDMARKYGYLGIEVFYEDLVDVAHTLDTNATNNAGDAATPSAESHLAAARWIRAQCQQRGLAVISLQPFMHYEDLRDRAEHARRIEEWRLWLGMAQALGTDLVLVPSTFLPADQLLAGGAVQGRAADLAELADLAAAVHIRVCYESLCWGTYASTWEDSWAVVDAANRRNLGLCLDTFNIAGAIYADPAAPSGKAVDAEAAVAASMARLQATVPRERVFLVQLVDAERLDAPLGPGHVLYNAEQPSRMTWSRNCRLFYGEEKAYLPVLQIARTIFHGLGYSHDWVSLELFNRCMSDTGAGVPEALARRGVLSWQRLQRDLAASSAADVASSETPKISASL
ncbi:hypothetical protein HMPREF1624_07661 [Sporothrix schenckii ATCC 58251]|uniref:Xylose isomerase-like TIM barrel domain-containing protein n=1 Tax=Sporothrix schenckii (strain ATCC 58251 / de Perez 2211183) TaxID=1391915 RepID=U7PNQ3_SPOS1|nr:hypothetical protein HMPREF1624_07661 [Sporothrix schenckii ATCC 58251]